MNKTGMPPLLQGQKIRMTIAELEALPHAICKQCSFDHFIQTYKLKKVSKFQSQSGRQEVIPMQAFVCAACHHPLLPKDMEDTIDATKRSEPELPDDAA